MRHTGQYTDVLNPLVISTVGHSGNYGDLLNQPSFATVASSGSYNDLANKPTIAIAAGLEKIEVCQGFAKLVYSVYRNGYVNSYR